MSESRMFNVLMVEDRAVDVTYYKELLQQADCYQFMMTDTPRLADAHNILQRGQYDLVLLDLKLLDSTPEQTVDAIPELLENAGVPVIVLSSSKDHDLAMKAIFNGAFDYLVKERDDAQLVSRILHHAVEYHNRAAA